jgi:integrase
MPRPPLQIGTWGRIARKELEPGLWWARARFRDHDGRTRLLEARAATGAKAERALIAAMTQRATAASGDLSPTTRLAALADYWLRTEIDGSSRAHATRERYRDVVENQVAPGIGGLMIREATVAALDRYLREVAEQVGPASSKLCKTVLSGMLSLAVRHNALQANPVREVSKIATEPPDVRALSVEEVHALRAQLRADKKAVRGDLPEVVDMMLATGARIGEVLALRWSDVDLGQGTVAITGTVIRVKGQGLTRQDTTKGKKVTRLKLPPFAIALLLDRSVNGLPGGPWDVVFPSVHGGLREVATVEHQWRMFRSRHPEWKWVVPHTFRKTVGTAIDRASSSSDAAAQLTHSSDAVTKRHYIEKPDVGPDNTATLQRFADWI